MTVRPAPLNIDFRWVVRSFDELRSLKTIDANIMQVLTFNEDGTAVLVPYAWDPTATGEDDDDRCLVPSNSPPAGRWRKVTLAVSSGPGTQSIRNIDALRETIGLPGDTVNVLGYYEPGDGGGGPFYWDYASAAEDDGGLVIKPTAVTGFGRWIRQV